MNFNNWYFSKILIFYFAVLETCKDCEQKVYVIPDVEHKCIKCTICDRGFDKARYLTRHMQSQHSTNNDNVSGKYL